MNTIAEANRYIDNAKEILREKAKKEEGQYRDKKYVKMAGHTAYSGVLVALDGLLMPKIKGRKSVEWYKEELSKIDKKIIVHFGNAYEILHLSMGYDGVLNAKVIAAGFEEAEQIIKWAKMKSKEVEA